MRIIAPVIQYYFSEDERKQALNSQLKEFVDCNIPMLLVYVFQDKGIICSDIQLINITEDEAMPSVIAIDKALKAFGKNYFKKV